LAQERDSQLSSSLTFFWKVIFPAAWIGGFAIQSWNQWRTGTIPGRQSPVVLLIGLFAGIALFAWLSLPLKVVWLKGRTLVISNFIRGTTVPLDDLVAIHEHWGRSTWVDLTLRDSTVFGSSVRFIPRWFGMDLDELRERAGLTDGATLPPHERTFDEE
jgi:hypothetical protein